MMDDYEKNQIKLITYHLDKLTSYSDAKEKKAILTPCPCHRRILTNGL
jgi:hypothetical protein